MATYIIRQIDDNLWRQVKAKCALQGVSAKDLILKLLMQWVKEKK